MASLIVILVYQALFNVAPTYFSELTSYLSTPYLLDPSHIGFFFSPQTFQAFLI